jgi:hypothetical protein
VLSEKTVEIGKFTLQLPYLGPPGSVIIQLAESRWLRRVVSGRMVGAGISGGFDGRTGWVGS